MRKINSLAFAIMFGFAAVGLAISSAHAAILNVSGGQLTGASGVVVSGVGTFDVEFVDGTCIALFNGCDNAADDFDFTDNADAAAAAQALLDQVFINSALGSFDLDPEQTLGCVGVFRCLSFIPVSLSPDGSLGFAGVADNQALEVNDQTLGLNFLPDTDTSTDPDNPPADTANFAIFTAVSSTPPDQSFIFTGDGCTVDCEEGAGAILTLAEYELGTPFDASDIVDFHFGSDSGVFDGFELLSIDVASGALFGTSDEFADVHIEGTALVEDIISAIGFEFDSTVGGGWSMDASGLDDIGTIGFFNLASVPEPGALALFGIGLAGLGFMRRRRRAA